MVILYGLIGLGSKATMFGINHSPIIYELLLKNPEPIYRG